MSRGDLSGEREIRYEFLKIVKRNKRAQWRQEAREWCALAIVAAGCGVFIGVCLWAACWLLRRAAEAVL